MEREEISLCLHFSPLSPFHISISMSSLHFLILSSFPNSLPISSQRGCQVAVGCDSLELSLLFTIKVKTEEEKMKLKSKTLKVENLASNPCKQTLLMSLVFFYHQTKVKTKTTKVKVKTKKIKLKIKS